MKRHPLTLCALLPLIAALILCTLSTAALADDPAKRAASSTDESKEALPRVFSKSMPTSINDLRDMEKHLTGLVPRLTPCTVNLKIGRAQGSGVIVTADGLILTAAHVSGAPGKKVIVTTSDGKEHKAISLGRNKMLDASMVKIQSSRTDWPHCDVAKQPVQQGAWCVTLGHPGGYQRERGLVLRLGRVIEENDWLIQTDCELIGGDSGGPLFNMRGEVIGINTRIGESTNYNFHVPASAFTRDWDRLLASEDFKSHSGAYLGIGGKAAESGEGLLIQTVEPGTPAEREGLMPGDILKTFQGEKVTSLEQLTELVGQEYPGESVQLEILRNGKTEEFTVRLGLRWTR